MKSLFPGVPCGEGPKSRRRFPWRLTLTCMLSLGFGVAHAGEVSAPSPFPVLEPRALTPPLLDLAPVCLPGAARPGFEIVAERVDQGDLDGARHRLAGLDAELDPAGRGDAELADAILEARAAAHPGAALRHLRAAAEAYTPVVGRACAHLELARLALRARLLPEARAELGRVERQLGEIDEPGTLESTSRFYAAEIAVLEGRRDTARAHYATLAESGEAWLRRASELRLADLAVAWPVPEREPGNEARWRHLDRLLDEASAAEIDVAPWSARAAEIAIAAGDLDAAHRWLADAERIEENRGVASIRKADVLVALDRGADARRVLDRVSSTATLRAARDLASVRRAGYGVGGESTEQRIARLERGAASLHPHVAAFARYELARVQLAAGNVTQTLEALARLAYTGALPGVDDGLTQTLDRAVRAAAPPTVSCATLLERLGGRRNLFIGSSNEPRPFLRLGDCFLELDMPRQALGVYRQLARRFGSADELGLPLRVARASLAARDLPILRASLRAYFADPAAASGRDARSADGARWRWLRARLDLFDGEVTRAATALEQLALRESLPDTVRVGIEQALAELPEDALSGRSLGVALASSLARPTPAVDPARRAAAWLRLADLQVDQERTTVARAAYRRAAELLPDGPRRTRALFAAGMLVTKGSFIPKSLEAARGAESAEGWSRLADAELRLIALRAAARGEVLGR